MNALETTTTMDTMDDATFDDEKNATTEDDTTFNYDTLVDNDIHCDFKYFVVHEGEATEEGLRKEPVSPVYISITCS